MPDRQRIVECSVPSSWNQDRGLKTDPTASPCAWIQGLGEECEALVTSRHQQIRTVEREGCDYCICVTIICFWINAAHSTESTLSETRFYITTNLLKIWCIGKEVIVQQHCRLKNRSFSDFIAKMFIWMTFTNRRKTNQTVKCWCLISPFVSSFYAPLHLYWGEILNSLGASAILAHSFQQKLTFDPLHSFC